MNSGVGSRAIDCNPQVHEKVLTPSTQCPLLRQLVGVQSSMSERSRQKRKSRNTAQEQLALALWMNSETARGAKRTVLAVIAAETRQTLCVQSSASNKAVGQHNEKAQIRAPRTANNDEETGIQTADRHTPCT